MTQMKQQAVEMIRRIPDENMVFILGILQNIEEMTNQRAGEDSLESFRAAARNISIDQEAVEQYRLENMV